MKELTFEQALDYFQDAWCEFTAHSSVRDKWSRGCRGVGQCAVTALVINDFFGGKIMRVELADGGSHYFNNVDGRDLDFTIDQSDCVPMEMKFPAETRSRAELLSTYDTAIRYGVLLNRFVAEMTKTPDQRIEDRSVRWQEL